MPLKEKETWNHLKNQVDFYLVRFKLLLGKFSKPFEYGTRTEKSGLELEILKSS